MPSTSAKAGWRIPLDTDPVSDTALAVRNLVTDQEAAWVNWSPTLTGFALGTPGQKLVSRYKLRGYCYDMRLNIVGGTGASGGGILTISAPPGLVRAGLDDEQILTGHHYDGATNRPCWALVRSTGFLIQSSSTGTWVTAFAAGHQIQLQGAIEIA